MSKKEFLEVLILVLVEHTLGVTKQEFMAAKAAVLILVLVEHTLGVQAERLTC